MSNSTTTTYVENIYKNHSHSILLQCTSDPKSSKQLSLSPTPIIIGRKIPPNSIPEPHNGIFDSKVLSRHHAEIWTENNKIYIRDLNSSNGTFLNGKSISSPDRNGDTYIIKHQDEIDFGIDIPDEQGNDLHKKVSCLLLCSDKHASSDTLPNENMDHIMDLNEFNTLDHEGKISQILKLLKLESLETSNLSEWISVKGNMDLNAFNEFTLQVKRLDSAYQDIQQCQSSCLSFKDLFESLQKENDLMYHELNTTKLELGQSSSKVTLLELELRELQNKMQEMEQSLQVLKEIEKEHAKIKELESLTMIQKSQLETLTSTHSNQFHSLQLDISLLNKIIHDIKIDESRLKSKKSTIYKHWIYTTAGLGLIIVIGIKAVYSFI